MKTDSQDQPNSYNEFAERLIVAMSTNEMIFRFFGISLFIMFTVGILFWCIIFGLFLGFELIALIFDPAYQLFRKFIHLQNVPPHLVKPPLSRIVASCISLVFPVIFIVIGVRGLSSMGFCVQSLACILFNLIRQLV